MITTITLSPTERHCRTLSSETVERAAKQFRLDGALMLEEIVEAALVHQARQAFAEVYGSYLDESGAKVVKVGSRRVMITVELKLPFGNAQFFANPWLLSILTALLGEDFVVGAFGVVCSLPFAPEQHRHHDGGILFPNSGLDLLLPAAAVTVGIPLLEMNELHGTTALWLGSHRRANGDETGVEPVIPVIKEGSCALWDFRLTHCGTRNLSPLVRPLLYLTYCRPWFFDHLNFKKLSNAKAVCADKDFISTLSEQHRRLLVRAEVR